MTQRYDTYKDSGVQWLGEIPGHWECVRLKNIGNCQNGVSKGGDYFGEGFPFVSYSDAYKNIVLPTKVQGLAVSTEDDRIAYSVEKGDVLFTRTSETIDEIGFASTCLETIKDSVFAGFLIRFRPNTCSIIPEFYKYYFRSIHLRKFFTKNINIVTRASLSQQLLGQLKVLIPSIDEQRTISSYLDAKCGKIDEWVTKKQKEVEHLQELKQRVIADAVTRGLNPHVKMKETGVFWWKETPEHWQKIRLGFILQKMNRQRLPNSELLVCTNKGKVIKRGDTKIGLIADSEEIYQGVAKGDLLIHGMDTWHGAIAVSNFNGMCTPVVHVCTSNENLYFVAYYMQVMAYSKVFKLISNGVRQNTSDFRSWSKVDKIPIMLPSIHEQKQIVSYLEDKTSKIDKLIAHITKEIECIKEYKQRLISDVVTGQIKVC